ncbi:hypothetical protein V5799_022860 [Amblyomma americanum]|uniref:Uncharacterized protein n=1 Tax=Amblyomma americanum TaxID=6943 RepID=A0AAQ4FKR5_AMBAM
MTTASEVWRMLLGTSAVRVSALQGPDGSVITVVKWSLCCCAGSGADKEDEEEPVTYDLPDHTVTVTSLESSDLYGDVRIGDNRADDNEEEDDDSIGDEIERGRTTDSDKRRLKALDRQMGDCSVQLRAALHKDKKQRGKMRRIKLRTTKKAKLARTHRL